MSTSRLLRQALRTPLSNIPKSGRYTPRFPLRTMASASASEKFEWLVIMPDQPGKLAKRMEVRPEGDGLKIQGSAMIALASSKEEVIEQLKADTYARNEVWDFSKKMPMDNANLVKQDHLQRRKFRIQLVSYP
ncbi:hypothetical protein PZA11_003754 [Diplocarpon coronariae]